jgi:archaemetzincin
MFQDIDGEGQKKRKKTARAPPLFGPLPAPYNDLDWLATVKEEGQGFENYVEFVTTRSGRFKDKQSPNRHTICLVPIVRKAEGGTEWPECGPSLEELTRLTTLYFDRPVTILPSVTITVKSTKVGVWQCSDSKQFSGKGKIRLRAEADLGRCQMHVDPLLLELSKMREQIPEHKEHAPFCLMGVTMMDLFSHDTDLFVAGMAAGESKVAVFSFHRYHPCIKMDSMYWQDYGYVSLPSDYSYFNMPRDKRPICTPLPPSAEMMRKNNSEQKTCSEMLRRAGKLLVHELMHIYGIDHCIYYDCIMRGTGHLVEDFSAPMHLCPIDLRKMQFRLGFNVQGRYERLGALYGKWGLRDEQAWVQRRLETIGQQPTQGEQLQQQQSAGLIEAHAGEGSGSGAEGQGAVLGDIEELSRRELQQACKRVGIKANSKTNILVEELRQFNNRQVVGGSRGGGQADEREQEDERQPKRNRSI